MTNDTWTYIAIGGAALVSLIVWVGAGARPGVDVVLAGLGAARAAVLSVYVLAAFAGVGPLLGGAPLVLRRAVAGCRPAGRRRRSISSPLEAITEAVEAGAAFPRSCARPRGRSRRRWS